MKTIPKAFALGLAELGVFGVIVFLTAGTFDYRQAWVFLMVFAVAGWIPGLYLLYTNPVAVQRRLRGGPTAEARTVQKAVMAGLWMSLAAMVLVSALDHRFGWSRVPTPVWLAGDVLVAVGLVVSLLVILQNNYASAVVRVEDSQPLVSTGVYGLVRHPMYTGNLLIMAGIPLALGSYWGLVFVLPGLVVLALRIRDEEKLLADELAGYREYKQQVRYRLVPYMW